MHPLIPRRSVRGLALIVPALLLAGCTFFGEGDPQESALACAAPEGGEGWRIGAYAGDGASPRVIPMPEGGGFAADMQMILTPDETCVAGAFEGPPAAQELRLAFLEVGDASLEVRFAGLEGDPSVTCDVGSETEPRSGEAGAHLSYTVEPVADGCRVTLQPAAGAPLEDARVEWSLSGLQGGGSIRFAATQT